MNGAIGNDDVGADFRTQELERALAARDRTIATLIKHAQKQQLDVSTAFGSAQAAVALQAIVERKTAELSAAKARLEAEIAERERSEQLRRQLEASLADAQRLEAIGRLAAGVAHEINTPTQYVGDNLQFLSHNIAPLLDVLEYAYASLDKGAVLGRDLDGVIERMRSIDVVFLKAEITAALTQSQDGVVRIASIVRAMKEFSHPGTQDFIEYDINHSIQSTLTVGRSEWKYAANVELELDPNLPKAPCLPGELNQVLLNLLVNAAHAVKERLKTNRGRSGVIRIATRTIGERVEIAISDNGCGIPKANLNRIFEPFFTTKPVGSGTGQGLAMAWAVVVGKHGGTIEVTSEVGIGSTFVLKLPLKREATSIANVPQDVKR